MSSTRRPPSLDLSPLLYTPSCRCGLIRPGNLTGTGTGHARPSKPSPIYFSGIFPKCIFPLINQRAID